MELDRKLKIALDESRLLILGAQVLFGFTFETAFQEEFAKLSQTAHAMHLVSLFCLLLAIALLIAPSLVHQLTFQGQSRAGALRAATAFAGASLLPLTLGLGAGVFVIISHRYGEAAGVAAGLGLTVVGVGLLYGLGYALKRPRGNERMSEQAETKLSTKIEQMLTEARVVIPGAQALLGFQFIAFLTQSFSELPLTFQIVHMLGLFAVALAALLLMTPAAVHRIAYGGEDDETFFRFGSAMIIAAALPLAAGIAADVAVVTYKTSENTATALSAGVAALCLLLLTWFALPLMLRRQQPLSIFVQTFSRR